MTKTLTFLEKRMFLNDDKSMQGALIGSVTADFWTCTDDKTGKKKAEGYGHAMLKIGDCTRSVELMFDFDSGSDLEQALRKIDRLAVVIREMREALIQGHKAIEEHKAK